jgi:hypothetical protein
MRAAFGAQCLGAHSDAMDNLGCTARWEGPEDSLKTMDKLDRLVRDVVKKYNLKPE